MWAANRARWVLNNLFRESRRREAQGREEEREETKGGRYNIARGQRKKGGTKGGREGERDRGKKGTKVWEGRS